MRDDLNTKYWPNVPQRGVAVGPPIQDDAYPEDSDSSGSGFFANLIGSLNIGFGNVVSELQKTRRSIVPPVAPVFGRKAQPVQLSAAGFGIVRLEGPDQGHYWYIRGITVAGNNDPSVVVTGRADVFVSASDLRNNQSLAQIGLADWRDFTAVIPNVAPYSKGEITLRFNEELYIVFSGGTANATYFAACNFQDFQESNDAQSWSI